MLRLTLVVILLCAFGCAIQAEEVKYETTFQNGADDWQPFDPQQWQHKKTESGGLFSQFKKESQYKPPFRSPTNIALLKNVVLGDVELTAEVRSTIPDYNHRDACLVFGYQDASHYYYVHFGKQADDRANQIFIVNGAARAKISLTSTAGTPWTDDWHKLRVSRKVGDGSISVYFDDLDKPAMTAKDATFTWGQIGIGTFDDTSDWRKVTVTGTKAAIPAKAPGEGN